MIKLKQILFYDNFSGAEATWVDEVDGAESVVRCHSYAACQMDMLHADALELGTSLEEYEEQIAAIEAAYIPPAPESIPVPQVLTIRQAKLVLLAAGLLDDVDAAVKQADRATQIEWEYATEIKRTWPTLLNMQTLLNMSDEQVDTLFIQGALL